MPYYYKHTFNDTEKNSDFLLYKKLNNVKFDTIEEYYYNNNQYLFLPKDYIPVLIEQDYIVTYFYRYFAKNVIKEYIFEISKNDYHDNINYSKTLYNFLTIKWKINVTDSEINNHNIAITRANNTMSKNLEYIDTSLQNYKKNYINIINYNMLCVNDNKLPGIKDKLSKKLVEFYKN